VLLENEQPYLTPGDQPGMGSDAYIGCGLEYTSGGGNQPVTVDRVVEASDRPNPYDRTPDRLRA